MRDEGMIEILQSCADRSDKDVEHCGAAAHLTDGATRKAAVVRELPYSAPVICYNDPVSRSGGDPSRHAQRRQLIGQLIIDRDHGAAKRTGKHSLALPERQEAR
jgi:hypothetical protein